MGLELKQNLKMSQQLVMTPQLQQAINLLQLSRLELAELVCQEMEQNPFLEEAIDGYEELEGQKNDLGRDEEEIKELDIENRDLAKIDWEPYLGNYSSYESSQKTEEERFPYENLCTRKASLFDHLMWQLRLSDMSEKEKEIGLYIIGNLNNDGYLEATLKEIAEASNSDMEAVEIVLKKMQGFDPIGVAARDLKECLLIQAKSLGLENSIVEEIILNHLQYLGGKNYTSIAKALTVSVEEVWEAEKIISNMEPKPGRNYSTEEVHYITPDVHIQKVDDDYVVLLNEDGLPKLKVNSMYKSYLQAQKESAKDTKDYIQERFRSATWLVKSIHQRQRTIYKVAKSIIKFQREYFDKGIGFLKPLILKDVAEDIGMHESTVSRVTSNKYAYTPQGIFELKFFFNSGIHGMTITSEGIKEKIKEIITKEDRKKPLSDQKIVKILENQDIPIARRTVTKYREMMRVSSSTERKKRF